MAAHDLPATVYAFPPLGVRTLRADYQTLIQWLNIDAVVLVDGGTDIMLRGDESDLGTPVEDITSLAAVAGLQVAVKIVTCLGFGIDAYHGVNHVQVLENIAALDRDGGYAGKSQICRQPRRCEPILGMTIDSPGLGMPHGRMVL